jgi:type IX secretion system substrate protein
MNQDGQDDIIFRNFNTSTSTTNGAWIVTAGFIAGSYNNNNNQILYGNWLWCIPGPGAFPLNQGDSIPSASQINNFANGVVLEGWQNSFYYPNQLFCHDTIAPPGDVCIGTKFLINGQFHYGWFKVELQSQQVLIKEYAYQLQPNIPMLACDTTNLATGFSEHNQQQFNFSQQNNSIHISSFQKLNHANISIYDLLGKEILKQPFEGNETTINMDKKGIYFVEVKSEKGIFRKKVFIY